MTSCEKGVGASGGGTSAKKHEHLRKGVLQRIMLTLGIRAIDTVDSFAPGEIVNRFNPWPGGGMFSLSAE